MHGDGPLAIDDRGLPHPAQDATKRGVLTAMKRAKVADSIAPAKDGGEVMVNFPSVRRISIAVV